MKKFVKLSVVLLALALSGLAANACTIQVGIACPNGRPGSGIEVCIEGVGCETTDEFGIAVFVAPSTGTYNLCVNKSTLPEGATFNPQCQKITSITEDTTFITLNLGGNFCDTELPEGECWLTGGGTVGKVKTPNYSFGGVVYPGCSPKAAEGGNWNVVDHFTGLHFQGQQIIVDGCEGVETKSPRVNVNIIDFHGDGILTGIAGNPEAKIAVTFVARAIDNRESGGGIDRLYLSVSDESGTVMQIGNSADDPAVISTGNLQIHTSGCNK
jgi:hypothetical protein